MIIKTQLRKTIKELIPQSFLVTKLNKKAERCVLLTFDDGPDHTVTPKVLSRLHTFEVRAVFFVVGRSIANASHILRMIKDQGHEIGNHTYIHSNSGSPSFFKYWRDLEKCQSLIKEYDVSKPILFRPPRGHISLTSLFVPKFVGLKSVNWSLGVQDWRCKNVEEANRAATKILKDIKSRDIILLHDDNAMVLHILDIILPEIKQRGYDLFSGIDYII